MKLLGNLRIKSSLEIKEESRVSIGFECVDRDLIDPKKCYDLLGKSGIKYARCQTGWAKTEKIKGIYDFEWLDDMVDNPLARGIEPWFNLGYGNPLYMEDVPNSTGVGCVPILYGRDTLEAWLNYIRALTIHFKDRVRYWEIWNESDNIHFWYPGAPDPLQYAELIKKTVAVIKREKADAKTGACVACLNFPYCNSLIKNLSKGDIDFFSYHTYRIVAEDNTVEEAQHLRKMLNENGFEHVAIWVGESGRASYFPENYWLPGQSSQHQQAVWQLRRFVYDIKCGVELTSFFQMADMVKSYAKANETIKRAAPHGILDGETYKPKKSYETICRIATILSGKITINDNMFVLNFDGDPLKYLSRITVSVEKDGSAMYFYWLPSYIEEELGVFEKAKTYFEKGNIKTPVIIDLFNGNVYEPDFNCDSSNIISVNALPVAEYPMLICDKELFEIESK